MKSVKDFQGKVQKIETLGLENDQVVKDLLQKACNHVEKVMKRRNWTVMVVREFIPTDPNLVGLNENGGEIISVRVRKGSAKSLEKSTAKSLNFYPYEHIVGTLLHELVHIEHGPHAGPFYKLLEQITTECENDPIPSSGSSSSSQSFESAGYKLSVSRHNPTESDCRRVALLAAEKRRTQSALMLPPSGRKLGGAKDLSELSPREAAALATFNRVSNRASA